MDPIHWPIIVGPTDFGGWSYRLTNVRWTHWLWRLPRSIRGVSPNSTVVDPFDQFSWKNVSHLVGSLWRDIDTKNNLKAIFLWIHWLWILHKWISCSPCMANFSNGSLDFFQKCCEMQGFFDFCKRFIVLHISWPKWR